MYIYMYIHTYIYIYIYIHIYIYNALLKSGYKNSINFSEANHHYNSKKNPKNDMV